MGDKVRVNIIINSCKLNSENVLEWVNRMTFFTSTKMGGNLLSKNKMKKYNSVKFLEYLQKEEYSNSKISIDLEDYDYNTFSLIKGAYDETVTWILFRLDEEIYNEKKSAILKYVDYLMEEYNGVNATISSLSDEFWQNLKDINMYRMKGRSLTGVVTKNSQIYENEEIVDVEYNPGHSHIVNGVWFGACWAMWFGKDYFKFIPKDILDVNLCYFEKKELQNGTIRILLYENVWEYDRFDNRERQLLFRKSVGMDVVAHFLENNKTQEVKDPSIELETGNFVHGGVKRITYYYNYEADIVPKSKAVEERVFELDEKGNIVWSNVK